MKTGSDQTVQPSELSLLQLVGGRYGAPIVSAIRCGGGFSGAEVFCVRTADHRLLAVRRSPAALFDASQLMNHIQRQQQLHRLLYHVYEQGVVEVPVPLQIIPDAMTGSAHFRRRCNADSAGIPDGAAAIWQTDSDLWQLEPWMPGRPKVEAELTDSHLTNAVNCLNRFYSAAADFVARFGANSLFQLRTAASPAIIRRLALTDELLSGRLDELEARIHRDQDAELRCWLQQLCGILRSRLPVLRDQLNDVATLAVALQPVIRDLWSAHILLLEERVTGLIDLTAAGTDHVTTDLSRLARSWFGSDTARIAALIRQFRMIRDLNSHELRLLRVLDECTVMLSPVTWISRRYPRDGSAVELSVPARSRLQQLIQTASRFEPIPLLY